MGKLKGVAPVACHGVRNRFEHITATLLPVNECMPVHVVPEVQVQHVLVHLGGARGVANL